MYHTRGFMYVCTYVCMYVGKVEYMMYKCMLGSVVFMYLCLYCMYVYIIIIINVCVCIASTRDGCSYASRIAAQHANGGGAVHAARQH